MNTTILNQKEANMLERIVVRNGDFVTINDIYDEFKEENNKIELKKFASKMYKHGWFVRLKKGSYLVTNLTTRGYVGVSDYEIANALVKESYVSFGQALQFYGMYDQSLSIVTSIAIKHENSVKVQDVKYKYITVKNKYFYGWNHTRFNNKDIRIASKEKAIIDMLQFKRTISSIDMVLEKLIDFKNDFDNDLIIDHANRSTVTVQRILGFLLDIAKLNTNGIYVNKSAIYMSNDSSQFNAKWRLYYHEYFNQYLKK